ncbi:MAG: hypothetical protein JWR01_956 [Subtercola sp.]|nr:hypothetical protein [Subtercola sp.]
MHSGAGLRLLDGGAGEFLEALHGHPAGVREQGVLVGRDGGGGEGVAVLHDLLRVAVRDRTSLEGGTGGGERAGEALAGVDEPSGVVLALVQRDGEFGDDLSFDDHVA